MSKFFQALENAEKERAVETASMADGDRIAGESDTTTVPDSEPVVTAIESPVKAMESLATVMEPPAPVMKPPVTVRESPLPAKEPPVTTRKARVTMPEIPIAAATIDSPAPMIESPVKVIESPVKEAPAPIEAPVAPKKTPAKENTAPAQSKMPTDHGPSYGAAVTRNTRGARSHQRIFMGELEPEPVVESRAMDDHLVSLLEPTSFAAEQYRAVRLAIETYRREHGLHIVGISSPGRGEGKTVTAINVAGALAQSSDARVALVDADLRHPRMAQFLGLPSARGLSTYLLGSGLSVDTILQRPGGMAFSVVVAGPVSSMPYELLKSPRLATLFAELRQRFDFVVVDTPPVLLFPDVGILRDAVDGFIMVVRANRTPREGVTDGLDTLGRHRVVGLVFNDDDRNAAATSSEEPDGSWRKYLTLGRA